MTERSITYVSVDSRTTYLKLDGTSPPVRTVECVPDLVYVDVDVQGEPVGVEVLERPSDVYAGDLWPLLTDYGDVGTLIVTRFIQLAHDDPAVDTE